MSTEQVRQEVLSALAVRQPAHEDEEDNERAVFTVNVTTIVTHYQSLCRYERERTLSVIALSTWILLVPRIVVLVFGVFLPLLQLFLFFVRRRELDRQQQARDAVVHLEKHTPLATMTPNKTPPLRANGFVAAGRPPTTMSSLAHVAHHNGGSNNDDEASDNAEETDDAEASLESVDTNDVDDTDSTDGIPQRQPVVAHSERVTRRSTSPSAPAMLLTDSPSSSGRGVKTSKMTLKPKP
jgi:hypothetical protein